MPSLIDIRRRIRTVRNTQQITKAMKMVSAARLRRAQDRTLLARPFARILHEFIADAVASAFASEQLASHPLLARREEKRIQLLLFTSDRGLAGAFNSNLIKAAQKFVSDHAGAAVEFELIGRKGRDFFRRRGALITGEYLGLANQARYEDAVPLANKAIERFRGGEIDAVYLLYNGFKSVLSQTLTVERILPVELPGGGEAMEYITEQPPGELLEALLPRYVRVAVHHALLESTAAEHAARMTAMDAATTNAAELIDKLTLYMNRVRQASITREIIEVVSGASALD
jgi:F-type H+-transporting ATPase subunit gamma